MFYACRHNLKPFKKTLFRLGKIIINRREKYQEILGFGGAVTDSACLNILKLTKKASDNLMRYNKL